MIDEPRIARSESQKVALIHVTVPRNEIQLVMGPGITEAMSAVTSQGIGPAGPWFAHHLRMEPGVFDFEICVPVTAEVAPVGRVEAGTLEARRVARTVYRGPYEGLGAAWGEFMAWVSANGHRPAPDMWERYLKGPESGPDPGGWETELNQPLLD